MHLLADYHTHTTFSHGTGSIEDNVKVAIIKGLKEIAITDHGLAHSLYGINEKKLKVMRQEVDMLNKKYPQIKILLGVEANLISHNGDIDVTPEILKYLDIVLVGFHKTAKPKNISSFFKFYLPNWFGNKSKKQINLNTSAYIKMLEKHNFISCITHLNYGCFVNTAEIAKHCLKHNVFVELNGKRVLFSCKEISEMVKLKTKFLINSDAHCSQKVGNTTLPTNIAIINRIPHELVANWRNTANLKIIQRENL